MLYVALIFVIIILILEKIINSKNEEIITSEKSFEAKKYLLTQEELKFYKLLKIITEKLELTLFCQVSLYEIIKAKNYKAFNKIKAKSIDFLITEKNCKILCAIELDDVTHNRSKRIERDNFINQLFKDAGIKLIRVPVENYYNLQELEEKIKASVN